LYALFNRDFHIAIECFVCFNKGCSLVVFKITTLLILSLVNTHHSCPYTYTCAYTRPPGQCTFTHTHVVVHTHTFPCAHTHMHTHAHLHTHTQHTPTHTRTHTYTHMHTHTCTHHTHTHTHTHTQQ